MDGEQGQLFDMDHEPRPDREGPARTKWAGNLSTKARAIVGAMLPAPCWRGCGTMLTKEDDNWTAGHIEDRVDGGTNDPSNLAPECKRCNFSQGGKRGAAITNGRRIEAVDIQRVRRITWL